MCDYTVEHKPCLWTEFWLAAFGTLRSGSHLLSFPESLTGARYILQSMAKTSPSCWNRLLVAFSELWHSAILFVITIDIRQDRLLTVFGVFVHVLMGVLLQDGHFKFSHLALWEMHFTFEADAGGCVVPTDKSLCHASWSLLRLNAATTSETDAGGCVIPTDTFLGTLVDHWLGWMQPQLLNGNCLTQSQSDCPVVCL